ncbi:MAG: PAS domain S-box protein, partial [Candidatus Hydrogenedentes bacterium]|nr:PAS domain S-box protein [Candidatus Hydrogenedentota bacterium]
AGTVLIINVPLTKMTGIEADAVLGHKVQELAKEYDVDTIFRHTERRDRALASEYELDWTRGDESIRLLVHESPLFDRHKRPVGFLLTVHDISVEHRLKKRLEEYTEGLQVLVEDRTEKLRASERRFRELLVNMNEGFLTIDRAFTVRFANERMQKLLRLEADELLGRDVFELVDIDERERLRAALAQVESGLPQRKDQDYTLVRLDRTCVPVKVSIAPIDEATEDGMYLSLVVTDVQELKEMHLELEFRAKELELANQELRETDRAKDLFLSNVSHELRTPLGTMGGYIEMLRGEDLGRIEPPQKAALDVMSHNVERLSSMINEMIESSRMEILGIRLCESLFSPAHLLHDCVDSVSPDALKKNIVLIVQTSDDLPYMWGDREKIAQMVSILLSNALKFSEEESSVIVALEKGNSSDVTISVQDTGIGIAPEYQEQIFRKFYQVDSSLSRHYQGTGIGLSIAKSMMEAHGGRIGLESAPGVGSTFALVFPKAQFGFLEDSEEVRAATRWSVYVANQFLEFRSALVHSLTRAGCKATGFDSGHECVRAARDRRPDLIILDEALSDVSVVNAVRQLRQASAPGELPIILLSAGPGGDGPPCEDMEEPVSVLVKPFTVEELLDCMRGMLGHQLAEGTSAEQELRRGIG